MSINDTLSSLGVNLEAQALNTLGAAVSQTINGAIGTAIDSLGGGILSPILNQQFAGSFNGSNSVWSPTPYAAALADGAAGLDPKQKFLFKVSFRFNQAVAEQARGLGYDVLSNLPSNLTFTVKSIDLPKYTFEYAEVNLYNFRSQVLKKITHEALTFSAYDDVANNAMGLANVILQLLSPATRNTWLSGTPLQDMGFAFTDKMNSALRGALDDPAAKDILERITIYQYYLDRGRSELTGPLIRNAVMANIFTFTNPRINRFIFDEMDSSKSEAAAINFTFDYDTLHMTTGQVADEIGNLDGGSLGSFDILAGSGSGMMSLSAGRGFNSSPGLSVSSLGTQLGTQISGGGAMGVLGSGNSTLFSNIARGTLLSATRGIASGISLPQIPFVSDGAVGGIIQSQVISGIDSLFG